MEPACLSRFLFMLPVPERLEYRQKSLYPLCIIRDKEVLGRPLWAVWGSYGTKTFPTNVLCVYYKSF